MSRIHFFTGLLITLAVLSGCNNNNEPFVPGTTTSGTVSGTISEKNFSLLATDLNPSVYDITTKYFTKTDDTLTVYVGDRFNRALGDAHTIYFRSEYGLLKPDSCITQDGSCSITWSATSYPPASVTADGYVTITAYTTGEESFVDTNGNGTFDDGEIFQDLEEPYVDTDAGQGTGGYYNIGDLIIDVPSANDPTGANGVHDLGDGLFNGAGCTHPSLCSPLTTTTVFARVYLDIFANRAVTYTIGGNITGIPATESVVLQVNGGDDLTVNADGSFTFATPIADGSLYTVTVLTQPTTATCTFTTGTDTGTISGANVTDVALTCA
jgi:hypothetical protein